MNSDERDAELDLQAAVQSGTRRFGTRPASPTGLGKDMDAEVRHYVEFWSYVGDQLASTVLPKAQAQEVRYSWAILKQSFELEPTGVLRQALRQALIQNGIDWPDKVAAPLYKELGWNV